MSKSGGKSDKTFWQTVPGIITSLAALITALGGCIAIVFGIPAISNAIFGNTPAPTVHQTNSSPAVDIPTLTQAPTNTAQVSSVTPTSVPQSTNNLNGIISVRLPTLQEIDSGMPASIWAANSIQIQDMPKPGVQVYSGNAQKNSEYLFHLHWCAESLNILDDNLQYISIQFFVNNELIPNEYIHSYVKGLNTGWQCKYFSVILSGWDENIQYTLEVRRVVSKNLSDGESHYSTGTYTRKIIIDVH